MKIAHWKIWIIGMVILGVISCQPEKSIEKVEFPIMEFTIQANADTTLFGEQGTRIFIGSETFQFPDGKLVEDSITIQIKEFYKSSDIVLAELSTASNGQLLETAGMINIKAFVDEEEIELRPDKRIVVHFPKGNIPAKNYEHRMMNLFYGDKTATDTSANNWTIDTTSLVKRTLKLGSFGWWHPAPNDSTGYDFTPKNHVDTGYYWNPIDFYISSYNFSNETIKEIESTLNVNTYPDFGAVWNSYGAECEMYISKDGYIKSPKIVTRLSSSTKRELIKFLKGFPQLEPGKNKYGKIIERRGLLFIQGGNTIPLYKTDEEYVKSFDQKYAKYENYPIRNMDAAEMNYYIFSVSKLGWINCDRFIEFEEKVDLLVNTPVLPDLKLKMIFSEINGVLKPSIKNGKYVFTQIPKGQKATIVGIKQEDGNLLAAFEEIEINEDPIQDLSFVGITLSEFREKFDVD